VRDENVEFALLRHQGPDDLGEIVIGGHLRGQRPFRL